MKKQIAAMAGAALILFGMSACAGKEKAQEAAAEVAEEGGFSESAVPENAPEVETPAVDPVETVEVVEADAPEAPAANPYTTTASGLKYRVIKAGKGAKPKASDTVKVNYEGKLTDGTVFDSSYQRGEPISFPLQGVIPGWTEGVQLMPVGSVYEFYIPYNLAYGERGIPGAIPPKADLIFTVELLEIQK